MECMPKLARPGLKFLYYSVTSFRFLHRDSSGQVKSICMDQHRTFLAYAKFLQGTYIIHPDAQPHPLSKLLCHISVPRKTSHYANPPSAYQHSRQHYVTAIDNEISTRL